MLGRKAGALARKLAQAFGMDAFGACRIEGDRMENDALLDQAGEGAMAGNARRLTRPPRLNESGCDAFMLRRSDLPSGPLDSHNIAYGRRGSKAGRPSADRHERLRLRPTSALRA